MRGIVAARASSTRAFPVVEALCIEVESVEAGGVAARLLQLDDLPLDGFNGAPWLDPAVNSVTRCVNELNVGGVLPTCWVRGVLVSKIEG
jgi:hypothetical protein